MDFNYYRENVSILQVAEALGYQLNAAAGKNPIELRHDSFANVLIKNAHSLKDQRYYDRDYNRGSVIDFVLHRLDQFNVIYETEMEGVKKVLASFAQIPYTPTDSLNQKLKLAKERKPFDDKDYLICQAKVSDLSYLHHKRKLSKSTLLKFLPFIKTVKQLNKEPAFTNIGFPYGVPGNDAITGFEVVNYNFRSQAAGSDKSNSVWIANFSHGPIVEDIYFSESAIDAMSFYQLYRHKFNFKSAALISVGGSLSEFQIKNCLSYFSAASKHSLFDNDLPGNIYDIKLATISLDVPIKIFSNGDSVTFNVKDRTFTLPNSEVSLTNFRKLSKLRPTLHVHKPTSKDYNQMLEINVAEAAHPIEI